MSALHASSGRVSMSGSMAFFAWSTCESAQDLKQPKRAVETRLVRRSVVQVVLVLPPGDAEALESSEI
jgi:hypothetical protein